MNTTSAALIGTAGVALLALAFAVYRWQQRKRVRRVEQWVREYLAERYGEVPDDLHINCSDDTNWPVLVSFNSRQNGTSHRLQFVCGRTIPTFFLLSETGEQREKRPLASLPLHATRSASGG